jgi:hypothetical protein
MLPATFEAFVVTFCAIIWFAEIAIAKIDIIRPMKSIILFTTSYLFERLINHGI